MTQVTQFPKPPFLPCSTIRSRQWRNQPQRVTWQQRGKGIHRQLFVPLATPHPSALSFTVTLMLSWESMKLTGHPRIPFSTQLMCQFLGLIFAQTTLCPSPADVSRVRYAGSFCMYLVRRFCQSQGLLVNHSPLYLYPLCHLLSSSREPGLLLLFLRLLWPPLCSWRRVATGHSKFWGSFSSVYNGA